MAASDDSRAFTVLKQNAEDFKASFDEDVTQCLAVLDSKITELLCDQGSSTMVYGEAKMLNAHMQFSKAKLGIFVSMKSLLDQIQASWIEQLAELKETFIENIEIFLAGTKLEVKEDSLSRSGSKKVSSLKGRKGQKIPSSSMVSSLDSTFKNTGKPSDFRMISFAPEDDEQEYESEQQVADSTSQNIKPIRKLSTSPVLKDTPGQNARRKSNVRFVEAENTETIEVEDEEVEDEEIVVVQTPVQKKGRGRRSAATRPASLRKALAVRALQNEVIEIPENDTAPVGTPVRPGRGSRKSILNTPTSLKKAQVTPLRRRNAAENEKESSESSSSSDQPAKPEVRSRRGAKTLLPAEAAVNVTPGRQKRTAAKRGGRAAAVPEPEPEIETSESDSNIMQSPAGPRTPRNAHFSLGLDLNEDLAIYSPEMDLTRSAPRRKTTVNPALNTLPDLFLTPDVVRTKSKRKTIAVDFSDLIVAPSPKRLKKSASRSSIAPSTLAMEIDITKDSDLLDSDEASGKDNYTPWIPLSDVGAKAPSQPGVYELKVPQAKKTAYIGSCESLRQKLTLHKLKHNTGHKHLDKFVERNAVNILVRYEKMASLADAKSEEKSRIDTFVAHYNTTPAFN